MPWTMGRRSRSGAGCSGYSAEMDSTLLQPYELSAFLYGGFLLGLLWEESRLLRQLFPHRYFVHGIDLLFTCLGAAVIAITFYWANGGEFRLFGGLFLAFGALLVHGSLGQLLPRPKPVKLYRKQEPMV